MDRGDTEHDSAVVHKTADTAAAVAASTRTTPAEYNAVLVLLV
jgi:hypothetical protein